MLGRAQKQVNVDDEPINSRMVGNTEVMCESDSQIVTTKNRLGAVHSAAQVPCLKPEAPVVVITLHRNLLFICSNRLACRNFPP